MDLISREAETEERKGKSAQNVSKEDLISRKAALEEMASGVILVTNNNVDAVKKVMELFIDKIKNLPAAQQDTDEWCTDCKEYDHERHCCPRWNGVIRETLKDAQPEITEEEVREWCYKRCLTVIDNALYLEMRSRWSASAQPEIIRCGDCLMHGVCRYEQGLGLNGYCSQAERRADENNNE